MMRNIKTGAVEGSRALDGSMSVTDRTVALYEKRLFRAYREFTGNTTVKFVAGKNFHLTSQRIWTGKGAVRLAITTGGTEGGTFTPLATKFSLNTVGAVAAGSTNVSVGGTHTGGTEREVLRSDSGTAGGGQGNGDYVVNSRYLTAGTYYFDIVVTGTTDGMYILEWEEEA